MLDLVLRLRLRLLCFLLIFSFASAAIIVKLSSFGVVPRTKAAAAVAVADCSTVELKQLLRRYQWHLSKGPPST